jgi:hypothetical protein
MGGSVLTVRVLTSMGFYSMPPSSQDEAKQGSPEQIRIYPLDSTDPAALNVLVRQIAGAKRLTLPDTEQSERAQFLHGLLGDVLMIGVSMGMTSEEPITHLTWFADLLERAQLSMADHLMVMTLPGSYLDQFARERNAPSRPLQPDGGTGTGGRMSAPATRVFLLPAALIFAHRPQRHGLLGVILRRAWEMYNLELATTRPAEHPFVQLAAAMSEAGQDGACRLLVHMPSGWEALIPWIEQLMEESLGKNGKGVVVFNDQRFQLDKDGSDIDKADSEGVFGMDKGERKGLHPAQLHPRPYNDFEDEPTSSRNMLTVHVTTQAANPSDAQNVEPTFVLSQPYLASPEAGMRLAALAASFLGWQLSMALFGYLHEITFAGQPAVENYKTRARVLRMQKDPLSGLEGWNAQFIGQFIRKYKEGVLTLYAPSTPNASTGKTAMVDSMAASFAGTLREARKTGYLTYLDGTINGEASAAFLTAFGRHLRHAGNDHLGIPIKLRRAPADYHSTEQSEMDGPPSLISLRLLARQHEACMFGSYDDTFLRAQAVSTWQAMLEQGRSCFLLVIDGTLDDAIEPLRKFFENVVQLL